MIGCIFHVLCADGKKQMFVIESMHRFRVGRNMFAVCVVNLRPEYRTLVLMIGYVMRSSIGTLSQHQSQLR
jgi:hypothetical protein